MDEDELIDMLQRFAEIPSVTEEGQHLAAQLAGLTFAIQALLLFSGDFETRILAAAGLARLNPSRADLLMPTLIDGMQSDDEAHRVYCCFACGSLGTLATAAVPTLTGLLTDDNEFVVQHATQALEAIGHASASAVPALVGLLRIGTDSLGIYIAHAWAAVGVLAAIGPAAHDALSALQQCLALDGTEDELIRLVRLSAAEAIWRISGETEPAVRVAMEMLGSGESEVRCSAVELLGNLGPVARPALPDLQRLLDDAEEAVRQRAKVALRNIGS
jgi:HEAT repeat protein